LEKGEILYLRRYVDDTFIIFYQNQTNEEIISKHLKKVHKYLEFKLTEEEIENLNYMDFSISRLNGNPSLGIYRKTTQTDTTIHSIYNQPKEHKLATNLFHINAMITLPIVEQCKQQEWKFILFIAKNKVFPLQMIHSLKDKIRQKTNKKPKLLVHEHERRKNCSFTYYGPLIRKVTNLFKHTGCSIFFRATVALCSLLCNKAPQDVKKTSGIHRLKCKIM